MTLHVTPGPSVRSTDPDTSHDAAYGHAASRRRDLVLVLETHAKHPEGLTDYDLAGILGRQQNSVGKRRGELRDSGYIIATAERREAPSKDKCIVWRITQEGLEALATDHIVIVKKEKEHVELG